MEWVRSSMFYNRNDAGIRLAERLSQYKNRIGIAVLALPRGGVVVGYKIAQKLNVPLDVLIVRKLGFPGQPELAIGAIAETGSVVLNEDIIAVGQLPDDLIKHEIDHQKDEIARRVTMYRAGKVLPPLNGITVILTDDGVATGATIRAAIVALKEQKVAKLVVAIPVGPPQTLEILRKMADEVICLDIPSGFMAVSAHYQDFTQVTDIEVTDLLQRFGANPVNADVV